MVHVLVAVLNGLFLDDGACFFRRFGLVATCYILNPFIERGHSNYIAIQKMRCPKLQGCGRPCVVVTQDHVLITRLHSICIADGVRHGPLPPFPQRCVGIAPIDSCRNRTDVIFVL